MSKVPLTPLGERVVATRQESSAKTAAGLYLPDNAKEKSQIAKVMAIGATVKEVKVGDNIIVREYSTTDVKIDGIEYLIAKEEDILAVVK
jgi:chaperonin GroES